MQIVFALVNKWVYGGVGVGEEKELVGEVREGFVEGLVLGSPLGLVGKVAWFLGAGIVWRWVAGRIWGEEKSGRVEGSEEVVRGGEGFEVGN